MPATPDARALVVVDLQNDFCPGGALPVTGGDAVARDVSDHLVTHGDDYELVVATMDWHLAQHPDGFTHFSSKPDFVTTWPVHCVAGTAGAALHPLLKLPKGVVLVRKGLHDDGYSGFDGHDDHGDALATILERRGIRSVDVVGLATDHCVRATAIDATRAGLQVRVLRHLTAGITPATTVAALAEMTLAGVEVVDEVRADRLRWARPA